MAVLAKGKIVLTAAVAAFATGLAVMPPVPRP